MERKGKAAGVSGGVPLAGIRGSAPSTLPRAFSARGIKHPLRHISHRLRQHEVREILEHPVVFQGALNDAKELPGQTNDGLAPTSPAFDLVLISGQVSAIAFGHQRTLHQSRPPKWAGGRHSELRLKKIETGKHRHCTNVDAIEVIRKMAGRFPDEQIAATLNRLRLRTGADNAWNESRVYSVRHRHQLPTFDPNQHNLSEVTLKEAAQRVSLSPLSVRHPIERTILPAQQVVECAPWQIPAAALDAEAVRTEALKIKNRIRVPRTQSCDEQQSMFSDS